MIKALISFFKNFGVNHSERIDDILLAKLYTVIDVYNKDKSKAYHFGAYLHKSGQFGKGNYFSELRVTISEINGDPLHDNFDIFIYINGKPHLKSFNAYIDAFIAETKLYTTDIEDSFIEQLLDLKEA